MTRELIIGALLEEAERRIEDLKKKCLDAHEEIGTVGYSADWTDRCSEVNALLEPIDFKRDEIRALIGFVKWLSDTVVLNGSVASGSVVRVSVTNPQDLTNEVQLLLLCDFNPLDYEIPVCCDCDEAKEALVIVTKGTPIFEALVNHTTSEVVSYIAPDNKKREVKILSIP